MSSQDYSSHVLPSIKLYFSKYVLAANWGLTGYFEGRDVRPPLKINRQANRSSKRLPHNSYPFFFSADAFVSYSGKRPPSTNSAGFCTHHLSQWKIYPWRNKQNHLICLIFLKLLSYLLSFRTTLCTQHQS